MEEGKKPRKLPYSLKNKDGVRKFLTPEELSTPREGMRGKLGVA